MPRQNRHHRVDAIFHVVSRGVDRQPIFLTARDRETFMAMLDTQLEQSGSHKLAYCLMPNHFHLLLGVGREPISRALQITLTGYSVRFNRLYRRSGHLFEARFWSSECADMTRIENVAAYIHLNPVRARITPSPNDWSWSSYSDWASNHESKIDFKWLSAITGRTINEVRSGHQKIVDWEMSNPSSNRTLEALIENTAAEFGLTIDALCSNARGNVFTLAKIHLVKRALKDGIKLVALAQALNCTPEALYMLRARKT